MAEILTFDPREDCIKDVLSILEKEDFEEVVWVGMHSWIRFISRGIWLQGYCLDKVLTNSDFRWGQKHEDIDGHKFTIVPFEAAKEIGDRAVYLIANTHGEQLTNQLTALGCSARRVFVLPDGKWYMKNAHKRMMELYGSKMEHMSYKEVQAARLNLLCKFRNICDKNGLSYFLDSGTLLGAVRHQGFIPWDDDVDVAMPFEDYKKLIEVFPSGGRYELLNHIDYPELRIPVFADNNFSGYNHLAGMVYPLSIDIFPIVNCGDSIQDAIQRKKEMEEGVDEYYLHLYTRAFDKVNRFPQAYHKMLEPTSDITDSCLLMMTYGDTSRLYAYEAEWYQDYTDVIFEGEIFHAPCKYEEVLVATYGTYNVFPAVECRAGHEIDYFKKGMPFSQSPWGD